MLSPLEARDSLRAGNLVRVRRDGRVELDAELKDAGGLSAITFVISDESKDRYGDVISADGWDFQNYAANPVLLWAHDYSVPPVAKMGTPWKSNGTKIKATVSEWVGRDISEFAWGVEQMVRKGFLNAVSVGFQPTEFTFNDDWSMNYLAQELLEISVVPVPANANALVAAKSAGLWVPQLDSWVTKQLDEKKPGVALDFAKRAFESLRAPMVAGRGGPPAEEQPLPEIVDLSTAMRENTAALREVLEELRVSRAERNIRGMDLGAKPRLKSAGELAADLVSEQLKSDPTSPRSSSP